MIKTVGIVSLSSGLLGEPFAAHEVEIGLRRLESMGLQVRFLPNARKGMDFLKVHPEARAADLLEAFRNPEIDMILCAIGGDDTYRLLPYLFDHGELRQAVTEKVFLGFSDTTINHLMLRKVGQHTFYGQAFLPDVCELGPDMAPYSRHYFEELIATGGIRRITPSPVWYSERTAFTPDQVGVPLVSHPNRGFELLQGPSVFRGPILGGCIDSLYDLFNCSYYPDMPVLCRKYGLFPTIEDWRGKLLLLESSEVKMPPQQYRKTLEYLKAAGVFGVIHGILAGKPMDETYYDDYKQALVETVNDPALPILYNLNIGHAQPRCILPLGVEATVDAERQEIRFGE